MSSPGADQTNEELRSDAASPDNRNTDISSRSSIPSTPRRNADASEDVSVPPTPTRFRSVVPSTPATLSRRQNDALDEIVPSTPVQRDNGRDNGGFSVSTPMTGYGSFGESLRGPNSRVAADVRSEEASDVDHHTQHSHGIGHGDENEEEHEESFGDTTQIRGTDINVQTAARTFKEFIQNFISVEESERSYKKEQRKKLKQLNRGGGGGGDGSGGDSDADSDDDSFESINTFDSTEESRFVYLDKIRDILMGRRQSKADGEDALVSTSFVETTAPFDLNARHLYFHSPSSQRLYHQLVSYPAEVVPLMDLIVEREMEAVREQLHESAEESSYPEQYASLHPRGVPLPKVQVRPFNLKKLSHMRALDPNSIDNLLSIRGMVVRTSPIIPDLKVAHFACTICSHSEAITLERGRISEPTLCPECNVKNGFELIHNRSMFADKQMVRVQETPNEVPAGETPASIVLFAYDDLVDAVRPGDRIEVTGVFRAQAKRVNPKISKVKSVYRTYLDVVHFRRVSGQSTGARKDNDMSISNLNGKDHIGVQRSPERVAELQRLAKSRDMYKELVESLAPSIWELDDVKRGVLCMLFGGNSKRVKRGTAERRGMSEVTNDNSDDNDAEDGSDSSNTEKLNKRGDINILLCGDPGTSKSQLLNYVHKLSPRGVYTSGKGSSAVGLTASIVRDPETRDLVLESGALVLSDLGICCIDEFDKMSDTTRAILHEAMEQQTVSIAKAGIIATLNARTSILASANPVESRYNPQMSVVDNIKLPPTLLSRFDLIYLILDAPNVDNDRKLATHLVGLYYDTPNVVQPPLDQSLLRDYIAYARDTIHPELSDLATRELITAYLEMRKMGSSSGGNSGSRTISATPRQLESLIRLSEAIAKMKLSLEVTRSDVQEAVRLMKVATQTAATDPRTGRIDMDMITTGRSTANREMEESLHLNLRELLAERRGNRMAVSDVRRQLLEVMNVQGLKSEDVLSALRRAEGDGIIQLNERAQTIFVKQGLVS